MIQLDTHCTHTQLLKLRLDMNSTGGYCLLFSAAARRTLLSLRDPYKLTYCQHHEEKIVMIKFIRQMTAVEYKIYTKEKE